MSWVTSGTTGTTRTVVASNFNTTETFYFTNISDFYYLKSFWKISNLGITTVPNVTNPVYHIAQKYTMTRQRGGRGARSPERKDVGSYLYFPKHGKLIQSNNIFCIRLTKMDE